MPSSIKTPNLRLNNWLGSDKPKKDDFAQDNQLLDQWSEEIRTEISDVRRIAEENIASAGGDWSNQLEETKTDLEDKITAAVNDTDSLRGEMNTSIQGVSNNLGTHTGNAGIHVTQTQKNTWDTTGTTLASHTGTTAIHVTQAQKDTWSANGITTGTYSGSGTTPRKITLGFQPKGGFVFAVGESIVRLDFASQKMNVWAAFFASLGGGGGVSVQSDGFTVTHNANAGMDGFAYKLNESGTTYVYAVWK